MILDPLNIALKNISETRALLENLIRSSESFDYLQAKRALTALQNKTRELGKLQVELQTLHGRSTEPNVISLAHVSAP